MKTSTMNTATTTIPIMAPNGRPPDICPGIVAEAVDEIEIADKSNIKIQIGRKKNMRTTTFTQKLL